MSTLGEYYVEGNCSQCVFLFFRAIYFILMCVFCVVVANEGLRIDIPDGCVLENRLVTGNLNNIVRTFSFSRSVSRSDGTDARSISVRIGIVNPPAFGRVLGIPHSVLFRRGVHCHYHQPLTTPPPYHPHASGPLNSTYIILFNQSSAFLLCFSLSCHRTFYTTFYPSIFRCFHSLFSILLSSLSLSRLSRLFLLSTRAHYTPPQHKHNVSKKSLSHIRAYIDS